MKALAKRLIITLSIFSLIFIFLVVPVSAKKSAKKDDTDTTSNVETCQCEDGSTGTRPATTILGKGEGSNTGCECGNGEAIRSILDLVVNIMTIGVGILGVVGISITGVQYLTAGGSEEKATKAKRRMFEIIIGLAAYAVVFAILKWLLPHFGE